LNTIQAVFDPITTVSAAGYVRGTLFSYAPTLPPPRFRQLDIGFEIDTGSRYTILLDLDFLALVRVVCPIPLATPAAVLRWVQTQPDLFVPEGGFWTVGGDTPPMFRIQYAWMQLTHPDDPDKKGDKEHGSLYGGFSAPFLNPPAPPFPSLLGRDSLARTSGMVWRRIFGTPRMIEISGA